MKMNRHEQSTMQHYTIAAWWMIMYRSHKSWVSWKNDWAGRASPILQEAMRFRKYQPILSFQQHPLAFRRLHQDAAVCHGSWKFFSIFRLCCRHLWIVGLSFSVTICHRLVSCFWRQRTIRSRDWVHWFICIWNAQNGSIVDWILVIWCFKFHGHWCVLCFCNNIGKYTSVLIAKNKNINIERCTKNRFNSLKNTNYANGVSIFGSFKHIIS